MSARDIWQDRPVTFGEFTIREAEPIAPAFEQSSAEGSYQLLALSLRWADSGERVFADTAEIWALPYRLRPQLVRLSAKAAFINGLTTEDPDAPPQANGHDKAGASPPP